jgi:glycine cleavage system H protein
VANVPDDLRYTTEHEWVRVTGEPGVIEVGITDYAQGELGDIVFVKAVSDLYCPVAGEVAAVNGTLEADPAAVNRSPYGDGWMIRLRTADARDVDGLLTADAYRAHIGA